MEHPNSLKLFASYLRKDRRVLGCRKMRLVQTRERSFNLHQESPHLEIHGAEIFERGLSFQTRCVDFDEVVEMVIRNGAVGLQRYGRPLAPALTDPKWDQLGLDAGLEVWFSNEQVVQYRHPEQTAAEVRANRDRLIQRAFELKVLCDEDTGAVLTDKDRIQLNLKDWNYEVMRHAMYHRKLHMEYLEYQARGDLAAALPQMQWWLNFSWERQIWTAEQVLLPCLKAYTAKKTKPPSQEILKYFEYLETVKKLLAQPRFASFEEFNEVYLRIPVVSSLDCFKLYAHFDHESYRWLPPNSLEVALSKAFNADKFDGLRFGFKLKVNQRQQRITSLDGATAVVFPTYNEVKAFFHTSHSELLVYSPQIPSRDLTYLSYWSRKQATGEDSLDLISRVAQTRANEGHKLLHATSNSQFLYLFTSKQVSQAGGAATKRIVISRYPRAELWAGLIAKSSAVLSLQYEEQKAKPHFSFGLNRNRPWVAASQLEEGDSGDKEHYLAICMPETRNCDKIGLTELLQASSLATKSPKRYSKIIGASVQLEGFPILLVHDVGVSDKTSHARVVQLKAKEGTICRQLNLEISAEEFGSHRVEFVPAKSSVLLLELLGKEFRYRVTVFGKTSVTHLCRSFRLAGKAPASLKGFVWLRKDKQLVALIEPNCYYMDQKVMHFKLKWS